MRIEAEVNPLVRWRPGAAAATALPAGMPLETLVEREQHVEVKRRMRWSGRFAVDTGLQLLRMLDTRVKGRYRAEYLAEHKLAEPSDAESEELDEASLRFLDIAAGRVVDGAKLYVALTRTRTNNKLPDKPQIKSGDVETVKKLIRDWYAWCDTLLTPAPSAQDAWSSSRMEHAFAAGTETNAGEVVLAASEYPGGELDWYHFGLGGRTLRANAQVASEVKQRSTLRVAVIPTPVAYAGMPATRWWEFEDRRVDFGAIGAAATDIVRMLLVEFANVFGNDFYVVPLDGVPLGSVARLTSVTIRTTFDPVNATGTALAAAEPFTKTAGRKWRMFELTGSVPGELDPAALLFFPPKVASSLHSEPVEELDLLRDETANMAWAVEHVVENELARPLDRAHVVHARRFRSETVETPHYRLALYPPDHWTRWCQSRELIGGGTRALPSAVPTIRRSCREAVCSAPSWRS